MNLKLYKGVEETPPEKQTTIQLKEGVVCCGGDDEEYEKDDDDVDASALLLMEEAHVVIRLMLDPKFINISNFRGHIRKDAEKVEMALKAYLDNKLKEDL